MDHKELFHADKAIDLSKLTLDSIDQHVNSLVYQLNDLTTKNSNIKGQQLLGRNLNPSDGSTASQQEKCINNANGSSNVMALNQETHNFIQR